MPTSHPCPCPPLVRPSSAGPPPDCTDCMPLLPSVRPPVRPSSLPSVLPPPRYLLIIWKARRPEQFNDGWQAMRHELTILYSRHSNCTVTRSPCCTLLLEYGLTYLPACLPTCLPACLPTYLPAYPSRYSRFYCSLLLGIVMAYYFWQYVKRYPNSKQPHPIASRVIGVSQLLAVLVRTETTVRELAESAHLPT
jgi:hypothetical protein